MKKRPIVAPLVPRRGYLLDLENMLRKSGGDYVDQESATDILERLVIRAGSVQYMLAVAPASCVERYGAILAKLGMRWALCSPGTDSADRELCLVACDLVERGYEEILVSSCDHYFSCIADIARLTVVVPVGAVVSRKLRRSATVLAA